MLPLRGTQRVTVGTGLAEWPACRYHIPAAPAAIAGIATRTTTVDQTTIARRSSAKYATIVAKTGTLMTSAAK
jgi:hypothetical protein